jgi:hypothetical protein
MRESGMRVFKMRMIMRHVRKQPKRLPVPSDFIGSAYSFFDDVPNRMELNLSDAGFDRAVDKASIKVLQTMTPTETAVLHGYKDKLDVVKKALIQRIMKIANDNMKGIQLQAFMMSFKFGVNKCVTARTMKVSRQSIQIRNKRAIRKVKKLVFLDPKSRTLIAEMQRLRSAISEFDA